MAPLRTYGDSCGIARALDVVGERWALLVVRELQLGPRRFTDLRQGLPGVGPDMLSARLRELEGAGLITRETLAPPAAARVYALTERGRALEPVLLALGTWGSQVPLAPDPTALSPAAVAGALTVTYQPPADGTPDLAIWLKLSGDSLSVVAASELTVTRGRGQPPQATLETDAGTLAPLLWHGASLAAAEASGAAAVRGDRAALVQFLTRFALAATAEAAAE